MDKSLLHKALRCDREPIPGYLLENILQSSFASPSVCYELKDALLKGLNQHYRDYDPFVKAKHLRLIRHLCEKGNPEFRLAIQRHNGDIKAFQAYLGPLDPLRGDAPVREVRQEAEKCIKLMYGAESASATNEPRLYSYTNENQPQTSLAHSLRIEGFGNTTADTLRSKTDYVTTRDVPAGATPQFHNRRPGVYEGFGNPHFIQPTQSTNKTSLTDAVASQAEQLVSGLSQAAAVVSRYLPDTVKSHLDQLTRSNHTEGPPQSSLWGAPSVPKHPLDNKYAFSGEPGHVSGYTVLGGSTSNGGDGSFVPPGLRPSQFATPWGISTQGQLALATASQKDCTVDTVSKLLLADAIDAACPARSLATKSLFLTLGRSASNYPRETVSLLLKKLGIEGTEDLSQYSVVPASSWISKVNVVHALAALLDREVIPVESTRSLLSTIIREQGYPGLQTLKRTAPKCREALQNLELLLNIEDPSVLKADHQHAEPLNLLDDLDEESVENPALVSTVSERRDERYGGEGKRSDHGDLLDDQYPVSGVSTQENGRQRDSSAQQDMSTLDENPLCDLSEPKLSSLHRNENAGDALLIGFDDNQHPSSMMTVHKTEREHTDDQQQQQQPPSSLFSGLVVPATTDRKLDSLLGDDVLPQFSGHLEDADTMTTELLDLGDNLTSPSPSAGHPHPPLNVPQPFSTFDLLLPGSNHPAASPSPADAAPVGSLFSFVELG